jgi:hypothetical protein
LSHPLFSDARSLLLTFIAYQLQKEAKHIAAAYISRGQIAVQAAPNFGEFPFHALR